MGPELLTGVWVCPIPTCHGTGPLYEQVLAWHTRYSSSNQPTPGLGGSCGNPTLYCLEALFELSLSPAQLFSAMSLKLSHYNNCISLREAPTFDIFQFYYFIISRIKNVPFTQQLNFFKLHVFYYYYYYAFHYRDRG